MQSFHYHMGQWKAHANIVKVDDSKLMVIIKVSGDGKEDLVCSQHTVVFEHAQGSDVIEEAKLVMNDVLKQHYQT